MQKFLTRELIRQWLVYKRQPDTYKGDYGHVLVVAGSRGFTGAAALTATGVLASGAGLVTAATPESQQSILAAIVPPEIMTLPLPETNAGAISEKALKDIINFINKRHITSLAIGPGVSRKPETAKTVLELLKFLTIPAVIDADAIYPLKDLNRKNSNSAIIVTPHPGELAAVCGVSKNEIQGNRVSWAKKFALKTGGVCLLKGHNTIITDGQSVFINPTGNPGMATGGCGDVLTGIIAALIPQIRDGSASTRLLKAACTGAYLHGLAGDLAAKAKTQLGMTAGDIVNFLPEALKKIVIN